MCHNNVNFTPFKPGLGSDDAVCVLLIIIVFNEIRLEVKKN